ncbi:MAG: DUF4112 domain-containing protein [Propionibacteriaceae bacterium]|nr:DUF4112 domain-containing protein [Propionibacteriaceae bacterium]
MTDAPDPATTSLERARQQAEEALNGPPPRASKAGNGDARHHQLLPLPPGSPARVSRTMAWFLDDLLPVPGTKARFGVDPILSFIPFAGTAVGAVMGSVILVDAVRLRAPVPVVARMVGNYAFDWGLGLVPFVGAFLDAAFRSNHKNFKLLERTITDREQVRRRTFWYWISMLAMLLVVVAVIVAVPIGLLLWLDGLATGR